LRKTDPAFGEGIRKLIGLLRPNARALKYGKDVIDEELRRRTARFNETKARSKRLCVVRAEVSPQEAKLLRLDALARRYDGALETMPYDQYLRTDYWKAVRDLKIESEDTFCSKCVQDAGPSVHIHHKRYDHRGSEHRHLGDLQPLCELCHSKHHALR